MGRVEDLGILHADGRQRRDVEEAPVVQPVAALPPVAEPVRLRVQELRELEALGAGTHGELVVVVPQDGLVALGAAGGVDGQLGVGQALLQVRTEHRHEHRPSSAGQSTSNQWANGDFWPSRSSDHHCVLSQAGVGVVMWLGTTSTTTRTPRCEAQRPSRRTPRARRPPR